MTQLCMKFSPKSYTLMAVMTSVSLLRGWKKAQAQLLHICINSLLLMQAAERALDIASLLLRESCTCCTQDFMKLACQGSDGLMAGAYLACGSLNTEVPAPSLLSNYSQECNGYRRGSVP